jgi:predicted nucleotidyltransferase
MDIRSTTTSLPKSSLAYLFGSFLSSASPNDVDVLIVYDPQSCAPSQAYELHRGFLNRLRETTGIAVHATLLTTDEERGCNFIKDTGAVRLDLIDDSRPVE